MWFEWLEEQLELLDFGIYFKLGTHPLCFVYWRGYPLEQININLHEFSYEKDGKFILGARPALAAIRKRIWVLKNSDSARKELKLK